MEKIIYDLHDFNPITSLHATIIMRVAEEVGEAAKTYCHISAEEVTDYTDNLLGKAALAIKKRNEEIINGNGEIAAKYHGITEGLCYAAAEASGMSFNASYKFALAISKHI